MPFLLISCEKDYNKDKPKPDNDTILNIDTVLCEFLEGWKISKYSFPFDINVRDIFFINEKTGFVVGYNGNIYKTINAGESWQKQNSGTTLHLYSVFFLNDSTGFVSGRAITDLSDDGGKGCVLLRTDNGGETWTKKFFQDYIDIRCLRFFNENNGLAIIYTPDIPNSKDYYMSKTSDGGDSWEFIDLSINPVYETYNYVDNVIFIAGENQKIFKSKDYGNSWETINTPIPSSEDVYHFYFYNEEIGFIDGVNHFRTLNGGINWETIDFPTSLFDNFHFYNETEGFNTEPVFEYEGEVEVYKGTRSFQTFDGGKSWQKSKLVDTLCFGWCSHFPERNLGYNIHEPNFYTIKKK